MELNEIPIRARCSGLCAVHCHQPEPSLHAEQDFVLTVTVRAYGGGVTAGQAAQALQNHPSTFDLPHDRELEIIAARPCTA